MASPSRAWVFTWNNYPEDAFDRFTAHRGRIVAINIGREVSASGTPHLQGHLVLKTASRLSALTALFPGVHFEPRRGSEQQAVDYTRKEGNPDRLDWDDRRQGSRSDLHAVAATVALHPRNAFRAVALEHPEMAMKYPAGIQALARALLPEPPLMVARQVRWFFGRSGTGKTYNAVTEAVEASGDERNVFLWNNHNFNFAGMYAGQQYIVIDELRTDWAGFTYSRLLTLLDKYRTEIMVKGGQVPWCATHIWITSPMHPEQFCPVEELRVNTLAQQQLARRISEIREYTDVHPDALAYAPVPPSEACSGFVALTQPMSDSDSDHDLPVRRPAVVLRPGAEAPSPVCVSIDLTQSDDEVVG